MEPGEGPLAATHAGLQPAFATDWVPDGPVPGAGSSDDSEVDKGLLATLLDSSAGIITVFDADGCWRYSNAAALRLTGAPEDFDPRDGVLQLIHPEDVAVALDAFRRLRAGDLAPDETFRVRIRAEQGQWRYLESTGANLVEDPAVEGIVIHSTDVTTAREAHLRLLEANERLVTLVGSLHIAALVEDSERVIVLTNEAFVELFELAGPARELIGRTLEELGPELTRRFGDPTRAPGPDRVARLLQERRRVIGDRIAMQDGRVLERDYVPIFVDSEYRGHLWLFRDISSQERDEAEWARLLAQQRDEYERLVELDRVKASFLAEISHELRTPLTSILSFTELLRDGVGRDDPAEQVEFLDVITRNAQRLLALVDDLVLLDRAETGILALDLIPLDLASVVQDAVTTFSPQAETKHLSLECNLEEGAPLVGDERRIAQLLDVLLSNAVKFTPEGGRVTVSATSSGDHWFISVTDTGIGVPQLERDSLFERFFRASNARAARIPGSGLGLSVARAIARLHGGNISIANAAVSGTVVLVALPLDIPRDRGEDPVAQPDPTATADGALSKAAGRGTTTSA
ncbi:MAG: PAS domain-containing sensor histidine kinase [Acidimicrobiales bacterium]